MVEDCGGSDRRKIVYSVIKSESVSLKQFFYRYAELHEAAEEDVLVASLPDEPTYGTGAIKVTVASVFSQNPPRNPTASDGQDRR